MNLEVSLTSDDIAVLQSNGTVTKSLRGVLVRIVREAEEDSKFVEQWLDGLPEGKR